MKKILIGSCALKEMYPDFPREPKDVDFAVDKERKASMKDIEYLYNPILCYWIGDGDINGDELLTLKVSHLFWDRDWNKHLFDCQFLLGKGHVIIEELLNKLITFWEDYLPKIRRSNLALTKEDFFNNAVNEDTHQHDHLHTLLNPVPMYTKLLKEGSEVELNNTKWFSLSFEEKKSVVFEETAVMAYERYKNIDYRSAFIKQLKDNIIKHFPRYIAIWAIINYKQIYLTKINYIQIIKEKL